MTRTFGVHSTPSRAVHRGRCSRKITGKGLKELAGLKSLKQLHEEISQINDEAVLAFGSAGKLHTLRQAVSGGKWAASDAEVLFLALGGLVTDAGLTALAGLKSLQRLYLHGPNISDKGMRELASLTTLRVLSMRGTRISDAGLRQIAGLKSLEELHIDGAKISDAGMEVIGGFKSLRVLYMNSPAVTADGIRHLAGLPLQSFHTSVTDGHLRGLAQINRLHVLSGARDHRGEQAGGAEHVFSLDLARQPVTGAGLKELKALRSLQILRLEGTGITAKELLELAAVPSLGVVTLEPGLITDDTLRLLRKHDLLHILASEARRGGPAKTLPILNLSGRPIGDGGLKELAGIASLGELSLDRTAVTDEGLQVMTTLPGLHTLRLTNTQVTDAGLKILAKVPTLASVSLHNTRITDEGLLAFAGHKGLHTIGLASQQISDDTLRMLRVNNMLHLLWAAHSKVAPRPRSEDEIFTLILNNTRITDAGLRELTGLKGLELINVSGTKVTNEGIEALKKGMPKLKNVIR